MNPKQAHFRCISMEAPGQIPSRKRGRYNNNGDEKAKMVREAEKIKNAETQKSSGKLSERIWTAAILCVIAAVLLIRLYDGTDLPLDFHGVRQLRSAVISRSYYYRYIHAAPDIQKQAENLADLEVYEPPFMEMIVGRINVWLGKDTFITGRVFSSVFWMIGAVFLWLLGRKNHSLPAVLVSLLFYAFLPFSVIAGRSFQPDPWMCAWTVMTACFMYRWAEKPDWGRMLVFAIFGSITVLIKVFSAFFVGFMLLGCFCAALSKKNFWKTLLQAASAAGLILLPSLVYYFLINPGRSGDFFSFWVISLSHLIFTTSFYAKWIAMIKGLTGLVLPVLGLIGILLSSKKERCLLSGWGLGYLFYGLSVPYQIYTHEYYSLILVPILALALMSVWDALFAVLSHKNLLLRSAAGLIILAFAGYEAFTACGTLRSHDYRGEAAAWKQIADSIPPEARFAALTSDYGFRLIYFGWRAPDVYWESTNDENLMALAGRSPEDFDSYFKVKTEGISYFLVSNIDELEKQPELKARLETCPIYTVVNGCTIYDLRSPQ